MKHPMEGVRLWRRWLAMVNRCHLPTATSYKDYGARGIVVCDRWRRSFDAFFDDMGWPPTPGAQIDRIDNSGPYSPDNCRWVDQATNKQRTRSTRLITANGETKHLAAWARSLGCNPAAIIARIKAGMSEEEAVTMPVPERPNAKLNMRQAREIRAAHPGKTMQAIANEFGVSKKTVLNIVHGRIFVE